MFYTFGNCTVDLTGILINERAWVPKMLTYEISNNAGDYRFGFNGMMKDNEIKGIGNSLDFGARMYDSRVARWLSVDGVFKPHLSSYQYGRNNPIMFVDPDGNTEYYFNGKWVGSDGAKNNLIGIVRARDVSKAIKKGTYTFPKALSNGSNSTDAFIIDANVLSAASEVLGKAMSEKGKNREFSVGLNKNNEGTYQKTAAGILEGKTIANFKEGAETAPHSRSDVSIHSHPTGAELIEGKPYSFSASEPSGDDMQNMDYAEMSIIVGKDGRAGAVTEKNISGEEYTKIKDARKGVINIYNKDNKTTPVQQVGQKEAENILTDYQKR